MKPNSKKLRFGKKTILKLTGSQTGKALGGDSVSCYTRCEDCNTVSGGRACNTTLNVPTSGDRRLPFPITRN